MSGGKPFAYERLMAIFESIVDEQREFAIGTISVHQSVSFLLTTLLSLCDLEDKNFISETKSMSGLLTSTTKTIRIGKKTGANAHLTAVAVEGEWRKVRQGSARRRQVEMSIVEGRSRPTRQGGRVVRVEGAVGRH